MNETAKDRWETIHENRTVTMLTGTTINAYARYHGLRGRSFSRGTRILEVGVGLGSATRALYRRGCEVSCLDISEKALASVLSLTKAGYLHAEADRLPSGHFALVIHHLVTQHMSDDDLRWQLPHLVRSLSPAGRMTIQWASSEIAGENDNQNAFLGEDWEPGVLTGPSLMGGRMVRSPEKAVRMIADAGGSVVEVKQIASWPDCKMVWFRTNVARNG